MGKQAPAWNKAAKDFAQHADVTWADVNLREHNIQGYDAGRGGWPTIRYFNKQTGPKGAPYIKKTDKQMCDELGPKNDFMTLYVEEAGKTFLCQLEGIGCSGRELDYIKSMKEKPVTEHIEQYEELLSSSSEDPMEKSPEIDWAKKRMKILKQMIQTAQKKDEL